MIKAYLAGPMSGLPQQNFPAFDIAAKTLRADGWEIVSPAELDDSVDREIAMTDAPARKSWGDFLARDVKLLADTGIEAIVFLQGWTDSRGARLEATVGLLQKDFKFFFYEGGRTFEYTRQDVAAMLYAKFSLLEAAA